MTPATKAEELRAYWQAMNSAMKRHYTGRGTNTQQDDLEVIAMHTEWPRLRKACTGGLSVINPSLVVSACESSA